MPCRHMQKKLTKKSAVFGRILCGGRAQPSSAEPILLQSGHIARDVLSRASRWVACDCVGDVFFLGWFILLYAVTLEVARWHRTIKPNPNGLLYSRGPHKMWAQPKSQPHIAHQTKYNEEETRPTESRQQQPYIYIHHKQSKL